MADTWNFTLFSLSLVYSLTTTEKIFSVKQFAIFGMFSYISVYRVLLILILWHKIVVFFCENIISIQVDTILPSSAKAEAQAGLSWY